MRHFNLIALGLAFTLVGCQLPLNLPHAMTPSTQGPSVVGPGSKTSADTKTPLMGTLRFAIRWPERDLPGFSAQVIPISTEKIVFKLSNPTIEDFAPIEQVLARKAGEDIATTTLHLPHGGGYRATVTAYDKDGNAIADNTATNLETQIDVTWGQVTPVVIRLDALFAPKIDELKIVDPLSQGSRLGHGTPGQILEIAGANLDRGTAQPTVIFPSGREVPGTLENGIIKTTIPEGAGTGTLIVKIDGVTSTSAANFRHVISLELTAEGAELGGNRDGDGAIASWLGDSFSIGVVGKDSNDVPINKPGLTSWNFPPDGIGNITADGTFEAQSLGRSSIAAKLGNVTGTREVIVAPPAGPIINPGRDPNIPSDARGVADIDLLKVGNNWLAAWYDPDPTVKKVFWRMFRLGEDGKVAQWFDTHSMGCAWDGFERAFRLSASPDENGNIKEICLTTRALINGQNGILVTPLDPLDGSTKAPYYPLSIDGSSRLLDAAANGTNHTIGILNFKDNQYNHQLINVTFDNDGSVANAISRPYISDEFIPYSYREDSMSITASGSHYVIARHIGTSGGAGPTALDIEHRDGALNLVRDLSPLHEYNRMPAIASNGNTVLVAAMELQASGTILKLYRYKRDAGSKFVGIGLGTKIADLNISGSDPLNWPVDLDWDGTDFILSYGQKTNVVVDGKIVSYAQAMVRKISVDNAHNLTIDDAYPLAKESMMATLAPSAEGGMALWLDSARRPIIRQVKYR